MRAEEIDNELLDGETLSPDCTCDCAEGSCQCDNLSDGAAQNNDNSAPLADPETDWKDKYLRLVAEFDNYRKRTLKEKMELIATGGEDIVKSLLVVLDDFDRAMEAMEKSDDYTAMQEGVLLIHRKLEETLRSKGVEQIEALGLDLDTDYHEAVAKLPSDPSQKGKIIDVVQKGYKLKDKVARHAKVVVGE